MDDSSRVSDADRDRAAALLRDHFAAGRLTRAELDDRLTVALRAATSGDLRRALTSLPEPTPALPQDRSLERSYRRLLAFYPAAYRRVHEEEMLAVLMTAAPQDKRLPGLAETADLLVGALRVRCQPSRGGMAAWRGALALISATAVLGLLAGIASAAANPPRPAVDVAVLTTAGSPAAARTQLALADSRPVLEHAALIVRPAMSLQALQSQVRITSLTEKVMLISAPGPATSQGPRAATAVAQSYIAYVSGQIAAGGNRKMHPELLYVSAVSPQTSLFTDAPDTGGLGACCGALIGAAGAVALSRPGKRFRTT